MERDKLAYELDGISDARRSFDKGFLDVLRTLAHWFARHWLFLANAGNGLLVLVAVLVPYAMSIGLTGPAGPVFKSYSLICAQNPSRSYFLFGHQMAMDQRMTAMYASMFVAGVVYGAIGRRGRSLAWRWYAVALLPMAVDGFTQLFGWRESNWELRTITGTLFGVATTWLMYPYLQQAAVQYLDLRGRSSEKPGEVIRGNHG